MRSGTIALSLFKKLITVLGALDASAFSPIILTVIVSGQRKKIALLIQEVSMLKEKSKHGKK